MCTCTCVRCVEHLLHSHRAEAAWSRRRRAVLQMDVAPKTDVAVVKLAIDAAVVTGAATMTLTAMRAAAARAAETKEAATV